MSIWKCICMKRLLTLLCIVVSCCICSSAFATENALQQQIESAMDYAYISYGDAGEPLANIFMRIGAHFGKNPDDEAVFGDAVLECLLKFQADNGLEQTGCFDFETLSLLLPYSESVNTSILDPDDIIWIPMHGGKKHHYDRKCSNMFEPRQMPRGCARVLGFDPCKRCYPNQ